MKKIYHIMNLTALIAVFLIIFSNGIQAQTTDTKLNQVELMKQFLGSWKYEGSDGNSAVSTESYFLGRASTKIPLRQVCHLVKTDGKWMIDYFSASYIPNRADMGKINVALE